jgi:hypothetical protein
MKYSYIPMFLSILFIPYLAIGNDKERATKQAQLDAECEAARERKLAPERDKYIDDCVRNEMKENREACKRFYSDYGAETGTRLPLYYALPECVNAFEFRNSYRQ